MPNGGAREGAGRKAKGYVAVTIRIPEKDVRWMAAEAGSRGISRGEVVHELIKEKRNDEE